MRMHNPPHPGESLREDVLPAIRMSVTELAQHLGCPQHELADILDGQAAISAEMAWRFEQAGLGSARQYLAEQAAHDLWQAEHREHPPILRLQVA